MLLLPLVLPYNPILSFPTSRGIVVPKWHPLHVSHPAYIERPPALGEGALLVLPLFCPIFARCLGVKKYLGMIILHSLIVVNISCTFLIVRDLYLPKQGKFWNSSNSFSDRGSLNFSFFIYSTVTFFTPKDNMENCFYFCLLFETCSVS